MMNALYTNTFFREATVKCVIYVTCQQTYQLKFKNNLSIEYMFVDVFSNYVNFIYFLIYQSIMWSTLYLYL